VASCLPSKTRLLALVASLSAANVAFRFALAWGPPNVKPIAFLVIVGGVVGGPLAGFAVGWLSMTLSDFVSPYGPGVWTLETSSCMAAVGLLAGLLWHHASAYNRWKMAVGGFLLTMIFDIGTSIIDALLFSYPWLGAVLALYVPFITGSVSPYPFGLAHELTTAILLGAIGPSLIARIRKVY
jgi:energy-coupling factor transport system substrate-specific component